MTKIISLFALLSLSVGCSSEPDDDTNTDDTGGTTGSGGDVGSDTGGSGNTGGSTNSGGSNTSGGTSSGGDSGGDDAPPEDKCREQGDCEGGATCRTPGSPSQCGICYQEENPCTDDASCAGSGVGTICEPVACACDGQQNSCVPGCSNESDCGPGESCSEGNRCEPAACDQAGERPTNFGCSADSCARLTCTADAGCSGHCVLGTCYDDFGTCELSPP